jgi:CubicO group peptidase (beta-lactamase class C family)
MNVEPQKLRRYALVAAACFLALAVGRADELPRGDATTAGFSKEKLEAITAAIKKAVDDKKIAGGSMLIARHGKVVHFSPAGMQDVEAKTPLSEKTIFRIASMSKPITSVAVMILVDDGKINVTDPLSKYVPEFKDMKVLVPDKDGKKHDLAPAKREITIHDLLTHSSGITYGLLNKPFVSEKYADAGIIDGLIETKETIGDNVKRLAKLPLVCQPGAAWEYGLSIDVLGYVVEVASGNTLDEFLRERVFKPLKMDDTYFVLPKEKRSRLAVIYQPGKDSLTRFGEKPLVQGAMKVSANYPINDESKYYSGGAGLVSTAGDYFRFCQMMLNRGELNGQHILKADTVDRMTKNQLGDLRIMFPGFDLMGYGFGILSEKGKETSKEATGIGSYSWGGAFGTYFWIDPKNDLIGVFMTQAFPPDFMLGNEMKKLTYAAIK